MPTKFCMTFVCQAGELELKSLLLAASLRKFLGDDIELIAAIPSPQSVWGRPKASTYDLLSKMGVKTVAIENPINCEYPIGNKIAALGVKTTSEATIFIDSDILCTRPFDPEEAFSLPFSAKPADNATYGKDRQVWERIYALINVPPPSRSVLTTHTQELIAPYFNAGVVCVKDGIEFSKVWAETCKNIDNCAEINNKRPWLDQIGLPLAAAKLQYDFECLDEQYNYPVHLKPLDPDNFPCLCHYHEPSILAREPSLVALVKIILHEYPYIYDYFDQNPAWASLKTLIKRNPDSISANLTEMSACIATQNFFISGIPRSGTSLLCNLLHKFDNCVVINEPTAIFKFLNENPIPWSLACYYADLRRDILVGSGIENKVLNGEVIQDTAQYDKRQLYKPIVFDDNFLLGTKNTLAYLARLSHIRHVMPYSKTIACIRNPYQTIASWKQSFDHLKQVELHKIPFGQHDLFLEYEYKRRRQQIENAGNMAEKRALLWCYLAGIILNNQSHLMILRYEDLIADTQRQLSKIFDYLTDSKVTYSTDIALRTLLALADKSHILDKDDLLAIRNICWPLASRFGYNADFPTGT